MKVSTKGRYALRLMVDLGVNGGEDWDLREFLREGGRKQTWDNVTRWVIGINHLEIGRASCRERV